MATNKLLTRFFDDTRRINYGTDMPRMSGRTLQALNVRNMDLNEDGRWGIECPKCNGLGIWDDDRAVEDVYADEPETYTCFDCKGPTPGWFRAPRLDHYKRSCMLWVLWRVDKSDFKQVYDTAVKEMNYLSDAIWHFCPQRGNSTFMQEMQGFWQGVLRGLARADEGGPFLTREDISANKVVQLALQGLDLVLEKEMLRRTRTSFSPSLLLALREAWNK